MRKANIYVRDLLAGRLEETEAAQRANLPEHFIRHTVERFASCFSKWEETIDNSFVTIEQKEAYKSLLRDRLKRLQR